MGQCAEETAHAACVHAQVVVANTAGAADVKHAAIILAGSYRNVYIILENKRYAIDGLRAVVVGISRA